MTPYSSQLNIILFQSPSSNSWTQIMVWTVSSALKIILWTLPSISNSSVCFDMSPFLSSRRVPALLYNLTLNVAKSAGKIFVSSTQEILVVTKSSWLSSGTSSRKKYWFAAVFSKFTVQTAFGFLTKNVSDQKWDSWPEFIFFSKSYIFDRNLNFFEIWLGHFGTTFVSNLCSLTVVRLTKGFLSYVNMNYIIRYNCSRGAWELDNRVVEIYTFLEFIFLVIFSRDFICRVKKKRTTRNKQSCYFWSRYFIG